MKRRAVCFLLCLSFFLCTVSLKSSAVDEDLTFPSEHYYATLYPDVGIYAVAPLADIVPLYDWYANSNFSFSDAILSGDDFILYDDLPYGLDTIVVCCSYGFTVLLFFLNGDDTVVPSFIETWNVNGKCMIALMSTSPIFRIGYNTGSGKPIQFLSYTGLTKDNNTITQIGDDTYYGFSYTFTETDIYVSLTNNSKDIDKTITLNGETLEAEYGIFTYPTRANLNQQLQEEENKTSKSILERIKELPSNIAESFKGLFIPSDGFFDTYQQEFQTYFKDRFGILYEIPELIISLLQKFVTFNPQEDNYSITFPSLVIPIQEDGEWKDFVLTEAQEFSFDFINQAPFNALYDIYVAFLWLVYIMLLINLIKNKANGVFKGG